LLEKKNNEIGREFGLRDEVVKFCD